MNSISVIRSFFALGLGAALAVPGLSVQPAETNLAKQFSVTVADVVERVMPSVVVVRTAATRLRGAVDPWAGRVYAIPEVAAGQGSGMILDTDGHILTSEHVIAGAQEIEVVLNDQTVLPARRVGGDPQTDIAVLKVQAPGTIKLTPISMGDSDRLRVGEFVIAIGSPFSLQSSVTLGIVSQKDRRIGALPFEDFIQTDAPINPGNSGGPLVDLDGNLVGVNAVIKTGGGTPGNIGIGFAVPVNLVRQVADALVRTGRFERPWLGILPKETRAAGRPPRVSVAQVYGGTPAARGGLRRGDEIITVAGRPVGTIAELQRAVLTRPLGEGIPLRIRRGTETLDLVVASERMPAIEE